MITEKIELRDREKYTVPYEIKRDKLQKAAERATDKLEHLAKTKGLGFPGGGSVNFKYERGENNNWVCGLYTGCFWQAYELTGNPFFRQAAEEHFATYQKRFDEKIGMDDHDVGFVFTPSCVAQYKLTGDERARELALKAADYLYTYSYSKEGKFIIRAHRGWDQGWGCRTMMDSLMNAPLFFWAAKETGKEEYYRAGLDHNLTTANLLIRADGSSFHHYQFDPKTAAGVRGLTWQGHSDDSCWSRGHGWGIYGFPIAYSYTKNEFLKETHRGMTYFMLNHLPDDMVPYWDYDFVSGDEPRDSSAGAVSVCGLDLMAKMLPDSDPDKIVYKNAAARMLDGIIDNCTGDIGVEYDGLVNRVTYALPQGHGIDECAVYGDFFYLEALNRFLNPDSKMYW